MKLNHDELILNFAFNCKLRPCTLELTISGFTLMKHFSDKYVFYVVVSAPPFKVGRSRLPLL